MRRNTTILLIGALVAALAVGGFAPVVSAHEGTDTDQPTPSFEAVNATDGQAQYMAEWMAARMGPEGVDAFQEETGTSIETVAHAMAENMGPRVGPWNSAGDTRQYNPSANGFQAPNGGYGPQMPAGDRYGHGMWGGSGPGMWGGSGHGMWGGSGAGMWGGSGPGMWGGSGPGMWGDSGPGMWGGSGHGMWGSSGAGMWGGSGPGMWGGFGPGWWGGSSGNSGYGGNGGGGHGMGGHGHGMGGR